MARETVTVPISGKILSVNVKAGDNVAEGDVICILESMKMENPILVPVAGKIIEVKVAAGQLVATSDLIAVIEYPPS